MLAGMLTATNNICWVDRIKRRKIYVGWIAKSEPKYMLADMHIVHIILSQPMHYKWLKHISQPRSASTLYAPLWHIWKYACSVKI